MEITFVNCMWAYLHDMQLRYEHEKLYRGMPGTKSVYGHSEFDPVLGEDYYVGLSEKLGDGPPTGSGDLTYGAFYPTRVFVWGMTDDGKHADRLVVLEHLKTLGLRSDPGFWDPCRPWWGFETGYRPRFRHALRADANIGLRQYDVMKRMQQPLPAGWQLVENYPNKYSIYIDEAPLKNTTRPAPASREPVSYKPDQQTLDLAMKIGDLPIATQIRKR